MIEFDYAFATDTPGSPKISKMVAAMDPFLLWQGKRWPSRLCELYRSVGFGNGRIGM